MAELEKSKDHAVEAKAWLENMGLADRWEVEAADDYTLQVDYDQPAEALLPLPDQLPLQFFDGLHRLKQRVQHVNGYEARQSKSGNIHAVVRMSHPMDVVERIAWQLAFGSDPVRESLALVRHHHGSKNVCVLFKRKPLLLTEGK